MNGSPDEGALVGAVKPGAAAAGAGHAGRPAPRRAAGPAGLAAAGRRRGAVTGRPARVAVQVGGAHRAGRCAADGTAAARGWSPSRPADAAVAAAAGASCSGPRSPSSCSSIRPRWPAGRVARRVARRAAGLAARLATVPAPSRRRGRPVLGGGPRWCSTSGTPAPRPSGWPPTAPVLAADPPGRRRRLDGSVAGAARRRPGAGAPAEARRVREALSLLPTVDAAGWPAATAARSRRTPIGAARRRCGRPSSCVRSCSATCRPARRCCWSVGVARDAAARRAASTRPAVAGRWRRGRRRRRCSGALALPAGRRPGPRPTRPRPAPAPPTPPPTRAVPAARRPLRAAVARPCCRRAVGRRCSARGAAPSPAPPPRDRRAGRGARPVRLPARRAGRLGAHRWPARAAPQPAHA